MRATLAHSDEVGTREAAEDVIRSCRQQLNGQTPRAGILFASVEYDHQTLLRLLSEEWPDLPLIGGSSDGELSSELGFCHDSVLLSLFTGDDLAAEAGLGRELSRSIDAAANAAIRAADHNRLCLSTFAPSADASAVVETLIERLGSGSCPVVGGLTGDHRGSSGMKEFFGQEVLSDSLPLLLLSGEFEYGCGIGSGWFPIGDAHVVTRSERHIVHEIDGKPALGIYRSHYGSVPPSSLGEYPLAVFSHDDPNDYVLRAILDADADEGWLRFAGAVEQGATVRMTEVLPEGILSGSGDSLEAALESYTGDDPQLALVFSCAARKWVLGTQAPREIEELRDKSAALGHPDLKIAGLYCYGEISPPNGSRSNSAFHNETCVTVVIGN